MVPFHRDAASCSITLIFLASRLAFAVFYQISLQQTLKAGTISSYQLLSFININFFEDRTLTWPVFRILANPTRLSFRVSSSSAGLGDFDSCHHMHAGGWS